MKRAAWALLWLVIVAVITAVAWLLANRFLPEKSPKPQISPVPLKPPTEADYRNWTSNAFAGSPWERQALIEEAALIAKNPGIAERDERTLRIFYRGKWLATLTPAAPGSDLNYDSVILVKVLRLYDPDSHHTEAVAEVRTWHGEFDTAFIVAPDGKWLRVGTASASPSGKLVVEGQQDWNGNDPTDILTWPGLVPVARFQPSCHVLAWDDETHFNARCGYQGRQEWQLFNARASRDDQGRWQLQSVGSLAEKPVEAEIGLEPPPSPTSKDPHLHFTATVPLNHH